MEPPGKDSTFADRLKWVRETKLREDVRPFARQLAHYRGLEKLGHKRVLDYEKKGRMPTPDYLHAVADLASVDPGWLLTGDGHPDRKPADVSQRAFEEMIAVVDRYRTPVVSSDPEREIAGQGDAAFDQNGRGGGASRRKKPPKRKRPPPPDGTEPPDPSKD